MKLSQFKEGQQITTYCCGTLVKAKVIQTNGNAICVRHKPIRWGNQYYIETWINPSTPLQAKYHAPTTPAAFYRGKPIEV